MIISFVCRWFVGFPKLIKRKQELQKNIDTILVFMHAVRELCSLANTADCTFTAYQGTLYICDVTKSYIHKHVR